MQTNQETPEKHPEKIPCYFGYTPLWIRRIKKTKFENTCDTLFGFKTRRKHNRYPVRFSDRLKKLIILGEFEIYLKFKHKRIQNDYLPRQNPVDFLIHQTLS